MLSRHYFELKEPTTMTDEELEAKLLEVVIAHRSGKRKKYSHRNPEGPQAVARIEELEAILQEIIDTACVGKGKEVTVRSTRFNAPASVLFRAYAAMKGTNDEG